MTIKTILNWLNPAYLAQQAQQAVRSFPLTVLSSIILAVEFIRSVHSSYDPHEFISTLGLLGIAGFIAAELAAQSWRISPNRLINRVIFNAVMLAILTVAVWPLWHNELGDFQIIAYVALSAALHGLVSIIPYITRQNEDIKFWAYNARMFIAAITSGILAWFLMVGVLMILGALDLLFDVDVENLYADTMVIVSFPILTTIFLARMPKTGQEMTVNITDYIRRLLSFIIWPLLIIYGVILWAYLGKIIIEGTLPRGVVWSLVGGFSFALLLASALSWQEDKLRKIATMVIRAAVPLLALQWIAIFMRIDQYGFTIFRTVAVYYSVLSSLLLMYFALRRNPKWLTVPALGTVMALSLAYGPLSGEAVGFRSQTNRLISQAKSHQILDEDNQWHSDQLSAANDSVQDQLMDCITYLYRSPERIEQSEALSFLSPFETSQEAFVALDFNISYPRNNRYHYVSDSPWNDIDGPSKIRSLDHIFLRNLKVIDDFTITQADYDHMFDGVVHDTFDGRPIVVTITNGESEGWLYINNITIIDGRDGATITLRDSYIVLPPLD